LLHSSVSLAFTGLEDRQKLYLIGYYIVSNMIPINFERENAIYELWKAGCTIDEISSKTGIPRSTVGYYVAKFNKSKNEDKPRSKLPIKQPKRRSKKAFITQIINWNQFQVTWSRLMNEGKYQEAKTIAESTQLFNRLRREIVSVLENEEEIIPEEFRDGAIWYYSLQSALRNAEKITIKDITDILKTLSSNS